MPEAIPLISDGSSVVTIHTGSPAPKIDPATGSLATEDEDGAIVYDFAPPRPQQASSDDEDWFANLADRVEDPASIVMEVIEGVDADEASREEWLQMQAKGRKMLGASLDERPTGDVGNSTEPFEGMSTVRHPLLMEAISRFVANASAELYPPDGPVKVRDDRPAKPEGVTDPPPTIGHNGGPPLDDVDAQNEAAASLASRDELAEALEKGFNHNLTVGDRGYRPDKMRMLFHVGLDGCAFVKVYDCPIRMRPMSRFCSAADVIVSDASSNERDAGRITHRFQMRPSVVKRMQIIGAYRECDLGQPQSEPSSVEEASAEIQGLEARPQRQEDQPYTFYESYVELNVKGYEHGKKLPMPWKVTVEKDSRQLLELRRNWEKDDETYQPRKVFVKFGFMPALGYYDFGFLHLIGNGDRALTAAWRQALDSAMYGNFPGFIYNEQAIRNWTNQNRVPPGGGIGIKGIGNLPLDQVIKPLPYKDVGAGMVNLITHFEQRMDRVAGTSQLPVPEGRQDAPVGTTLAMIEQATKVLAAVHINLHGSQAEELELLKERYQANPESFWKWNKRKNYDWEETLFLRALNDYEIVPVADPNTPSHMHRLLKWWAMLQIAQQAPQLFDLRKLVAKWSRITGTTEVEDCFAPPAPPGAEGPPADPARMASIQQKAAQAQQETAAKMGELQLKGQQQEREHAARMTEAAMQQQADEREHAVAAHAAVVESADRAADRRSRENVAALRLQSERDRLAAEQVNKHLDRTADAQQQHLDRTSSALQQGQQHAHEAGQQPPVQTEET